MCVNLKSENSHGNAPAANARWRCLYLPSSGTASDVAGIVSATMFRKTVSDSKIVTPASMQHKIIARPFVIVCACECVRV